MIPKRQNDVLDGVLEERIIEILRTEPIITQIILAKRLGIPYRSLQRKMDELKVKGLIEREGGKRYGQWKVTE